MSLKRVCDKCGEADDNYNPWTSSVQFNTIRTTPRRCITIDLCETCTKAVIRATRKYSHDETEDLPDNFGVPELPLTPIAPPVCVEEKVVLPKDYQEDSSAPMSAQPSMPAPDPGVTSPLKSGVSIKPEHSDVF